MDLPKRPDQILALQQAAGFLNYTVDELLRLQRPTPSFSESIGTLGLTGPRRQYLRSDSFAGFEDLGESPQPGDGSSWGFKNSYDGENSSQGDIGQYWMEKSPHLGHNTLSSPQNVSSSTYGTNRPETVFLLNPATATQFACDRDMDYQMIHFEDVISSDRTGSSGPDGFVHLTPKTPDSDAESESSNQHDDAGLEEDEDTNVSTVRPIDTKSTTSAGSRPHKLLAPRPHRPGTVKSEAVSIARMPVEKVRKKRSPYSTVKKDATNLTRSHGACVRCRIQRNRCVPDPNDPGGPCQPCQQKKTRLSRLPCLRYKISESVLFRTGLNYMAFYKAHPMVGRYYGDFHIEKRWVDGPSRFLCLGQGYSQSLRIELKQFIPPHDPAALDLKGRSMYAVNWCIDDPDAVVEAINEYINCSMGEYVQNMLGGSETDSLIWDIFYTAMKAAWGEKPFLILRKALRLWVACRFIESRWRCWADPNIHTEDFTAEFPQDPFWDHTSPPPYVDYQWASIIIHRVLVPLRDEILRDLERMVEKHKPEDWYATFLTVFILLQNYELQMKFQREFAKRRNAPYRYLDMPLVNATNQGAKIILAHFHYCCKGQHPFGPDFDWSAAKIRKMARLDAEQSRFMASYRDQVISKAESFKTINHSNTYDEEYWYTSQLFEPDWTPRATNEHAPPAEWAQ